MLGDMATEPLDLVGTAEAAQILGIERSTLSRWIQLGHLAPAQKLPGKTGAHLFRRSDLEQFKTRLTTLTTIRVAS